MKAEALDMQNTFFRAIEKMEEDFAGTMRNIAVDLIERFTREELTEDYLDEEALSLAEQGTCILQAATDFENEVSEVYSQPRIATRGTQRGAPRDHLFRL